MGLGKALRLGWDWVAAVALILLGGGALVIGWIGVSGQAYPAEQLPFLISGGMGGLFLLGLGALLWVSGDLRDEWTKLDRLEEALDRIAESETGLVDRPTLEANPTTLAEWERRRPTRQAAAGDR